MASLEAHDLQPLIDRHYARIRRAALAMCHDNWEADEIAQETFLAAYESSDQFRSESTEGTWLYGICLRIHRQRRRSLTRSLRRIACWIVDNGKLEATDNAALEEEVREWRRGIWQHVLELPVRQREVVVLRFSEELPVAEIALALGCPEGTVKSRLHHGLARLKQKLTRELPPETRASNEANGSTCDQTSSGAYDTCVGIEEIT